MVAYNLPKDIRGLIFDMDLTLYRHDDYYSSQLKNQVLVLATDLGRPAAELQSSLDDWEHEFTSRTGRKPSFGNTLLGALGIPILQSVELRRRAIRPEDYLLPDPRLETTLSVLESRFQLILVTNNPADIALRTLKVLAVERFFPRVIGLDETGHSKPHPRAFELAYAALNLDPRNIVSVGDRYPVDLEVPLQLGSGGVLVESMEDVYSLPALLSQT
jgi:phosphoglycolate phosphatase/putative hydrolase of the HAD superfamily